MSDFTSCTHVLRLLVPLCVLAALSIFLFGHNNILHENGVFRPRGQPRSRFFAEERVVGRPILARGASRVSVLRLVDNSDTHDGNDNSAEKRRDVGQYLVRTIFPPPVGLSDYLTELASGGFIQYIPHDTFAVAMDGFAVEKAQNHDGVVDVYQLPTHIKIDPQLLEYMDAAIVRRNTDTDAPDGVVDPPRKHGRKHNTHVVYAMLAYGGPEWLHDAHSMTIEWQNTLSDMNISGNTWLASPEKAAVEVVGVLALKQMVAMLAQHPRVHWIEARSEITMRNKEAGLALQSSDANSHRIWQKGILGAGQIVGLANTGIDYDNCFFHDAAMPVPPRCLGPGFVQNTACINHSHRKIVTYRRFETSYFQDYPNGHGTHVAGSIAGSTTNTDTPELTFAHQFNGAAPLAKIAFDDVASSDGTISVPVDLGIDLFPHSYAAGARVYSISWGTTSIFYDMMAMEIDKFVYTHDDFTVLIAAGNDGPASWTVGSPATAKNMLAVGASEQQRSVPVYKMQIRIMPTFATPEFLHDIIAVAAFGPVVHTLSSTTLAIAVASPLDACAPVQFMPGRIALIQRGTCTFESKALQAQDAGALFVLFFNNVDENVMIMGSENDVSQLTIPCVMISKTHGEAVQGAAVVAASQMLQVSVVVPIVTNTGGDNVVRHTLADTSARGPTDELRIKPDVLCPGVNIYSAHSDGNTNTLNCGMNIRAPNAAVAVMSGTSMATPLCAGAAAMVREYFVKGFSVSGHANASVGFMPSAALVKAVMIHSAQPVKIRPPTASFQPGGAPRPQPPALYETRYPNMQSGYGQVQLSSALQFDDSFFQAVYVDRQELLHGKHARFCFRVHSSNGTDSFFRVSLVWTDPPGDPTSSRSLVNDLDLVVHTPDKTTLFGNALMQTDETHGTYAVRDSINNAEQVRVLNPVSGIYTVHVLARDVVMGPQKFALVASASSMTAMIPTAECARPSCPNACSGVGECLSSGICQCPFTHGGEDCARLHKRLFLQTGQTIVSTVLSVTWLGMSYYSIEIAEEGSFSLSIANEAPKTRSDADFYLARGRLPSKNDHDASIADIFSSGTFQSMGNATGFWVLAVLAYEGNVVLSVSLTPSKNATAADNVFGSKTVFLHESTSAENGASTDMLSCSSECQCQTFTSATGSLADRSSYGNNYADDTTCWWMIVPNTTDMAQLVLEFGSFVTESFYDTITIYECFDTMCLNISQIEVLSGPDIAMPHTVSTLTGAMMYDIPWVFRRVVDGTQKRQVVDLGVGATGGGFVTGVSGIITSEYTADVFQKYRWIIGGGLADEVVLLSFELPATFTGFILIDECAGLDWNITANTSVSLLLVPLCRNPKLVASFRSVQGVYNYTGAGAMQIQFQPDLQQHTPHLQVLWRIAAADSIVQTPPEPEADHALAICRPPLCVRFEYATASGILEYGTSGASYMANSDYMWSIVIYGADWVKLRFSLFDVEMGYDMVKIYECTGASYDAHCLHDSSWTLLAQLSGSLADNTAPACIHDWLLARGGIRMHFTSDSTIQKRGFEAAWTSLSTPPPAVVDIQIDTSVTRKKPESMLMELWCRLVDALQ